MAGPAFGPNETEDMCPQLVGGEDLQAFAAEDSKFPHKTIIRNFVARLSTYLHAREYHVVEAGDQGEEGVEHPAGQAQLVKACRECGK